MYPLDSRFVVITIFESPSNKGSAYNKPVINWLEISPLTLNVPHFNPEYTFKGR